MKEFIYILVSAIIVQTPLFGQQTYPTLSVTKGEVVEIRSALGQGTLFDTSIDKVRAQVDQFVTTGLDVPVPKDLAGGYTHEQHKKNFLILQKAGLLFQITEEEKYAILIKETLFKYREMYPKLERHPSTKSYARGKLFWQCLNDANWLVYVSQAYDCIYDWLSEKERKELNKELFVPMANFLSVETPRFFNRLHNHSTWANAAVGMIGLVMENEDLVQKALNGLPMSKEALKDNDGGSITLKGQKKAGFLAQIDFSFSPDGYYTEGPYYQRYAMYPFLIFALALDNSKPEVKIFEYNNEVLIKGVYALLNQTNAKGEFFPLNDAQKGMSYFSRELKLALSLAYQYGTKDPSLLSLIELQESVPLIYSGMQAALAIKEGKTIPFVKKSVMLRDGAKGDEGAIGILRADKEGEVDLIMKYAKHGMGHGHFDRLSYSMFYGEQEVLQDYGAARWVNINQKDGGGYLKENKTWAKQTVAHNTVVVDEKSQFRGKVKAADAIAPTSYIFDVDNPNLQVVSAKDTNCYTGVELQRTMILLKDSSFENPLVLDLFAVNSEEEHDLLLPYYYKGQLMQTNIDFKQSTTLSAMGESDGFQHLWKEAEGKAAEGVTQINWFDKATFFTLTSTTTASDNIITAHIGANDPNFNLRHDPAFFLQKKGKKGRTLFASILETHGKYSRVSEFATNAYGSITDITIIDNTSEYTVVNFTNKQDEEWTFIISNKQRSDASKHRLTIENREIKWGGPFTLFKNELEQ
ncbi:alginate lyase family protein [Flammeovirga pectinis]|uniref:Alginate lyase family protein n=1 Tax=Flammeovirga pectinis TaxID=2494373 RepID=A0A3Q9FQ75_9BACT|nr:alginate lyase family protein [Flammeovirga pectinis]AZQ62760.1 alginate lyase family protein [Flammeovirga pectinis]